MTITYWISGSGYIYYPKTLLIICYVGIIPNHGYAESSRGIVDANFGRVGGIRNINYPQATPSIGYIGEIPGQDYIMSISWCIVKTNFNGIGRVRDVYHP